MLNLGKRLKALRTERDLTLAQLGEQLNVSASYLSQIERGLTMPSLPRLAAIARTLDVELVHFFEEDMTSPCIVRESCGRKLMDTASLIVESLSADPAGKAMQPHRIVCQPGTSGEALPKGPGEESGFVLKGQLTVTVGDETFVLRPGDSIHYQRLQTHSWRNDGDQECVAIWVAWPPVPETELGRWLTLRKGGDAAEATK
jgi:transcriptional regulator with XRE-family HTH domain/mannose-6-phosphate isomerase-like protein (cupin superfamily)